MFSSCIDKWLKGQGGKCPHCNAKAKRQDIRVIYAKSIKVSFKLYAYTSMLFLQREITFVTP